MRYSSSVWAALGVTLALCGAAGVYAYQKSDTVKVGVQGALAKLGELRGAEPQVVVPEGTTLTLGLGTRLSTQDSKVGDSFTAEVLTPVQVDGQAVIPEGAQITGHVLEAIQPGKASGRGRLVLVFDQLALGDRHYDVGAESQTFWSRSGARKDAAMIGGGAIAGGVVGGLLGGSAGSAAKGLVLGGAAGTGASLLTRGPQLTLEPGARLEMRLIQPLAVRPPQSA
jgi:hypothetical protein